ncbi:hypothetical protein E1264_39100 [Actinomadura sp. KC216]|uniref:hypothetical protein n=1 Tax=Actinomadura sp. KC216 TaxID=2530370 RepID=UPI0010461251|nr:hypothetical protein [Actinomadura sp. KC216]TDB76049.1 hypothetical protein E1264_39100 [Actinomadura sp. KC216]
MRSRLELRCAFRREATTAHLAPGGALASRGARAPGLAALADVCRWWTGPFLADMPRPHVLFPEACAVTPAPSSLAYDLRALD